jgi:hypothetical protein
VAGTGAVDLGGVPNPKVVIDHGMHEGVPVLHLLAVGNETSGSAAACDTDQLSSSIRYRFNQRF